LAARQLSRQAESFIAAGRWEDAVPKARGLPIDAREPTALRAVAQLQSATGDVSAAISFWESLKELNAMTRADRQQYAEDLFHAGRVADAETENDALQAEAPNDPATLRLAARIAAAKRLYGQSLEYARRAHEADPGNGRENSSSASRIQLARLPFATGRPSGAARSGRDRGKSGLEALTYLAAQRDLPAADVQTIIPS